MRLSLLAVAQVCKLCSKRGSLYRMSFIYLDISIIDLLSVSDASVLGCCGLGSGYPRSVARSATLVFG